ncbi:Eco57I restriction-modification methylase domain-containing protein [Pararhizobium sp. BT-229]|uniref:Eco57I restriction-modification methylase domain-containing protein n=1 Tax=Pararhizobium sp. BT-229 TaxID=2986923 RepID=UPI0021F7ED82|nr:Eco57I restriction-modification methylase domain-containing protein [Pararhizobium sp. BT-229]MCV9964712.1 Eco57I restriction-modification methylase domain-containing protein [Pararhizobium sp. BT-229]
MDIEDIRRRVSASLDPSRRSEFGQFFTPSDIASYMAGLFTPTTRAVRLLDAGAGVGCLLHAAASMMTVERVDAWEIDGSLVDPLASTLADIGAPFEIHHSDFILDARDLVASGVTFDRVILNPPYRKVSNSSPHRKAVEELGVRTVNLYTAFVAAALLAMREGGEIVAIVPRSFLNGLYHRPFRKFMLSIASLDAIHVFNSRRSAFSDDAVLQENVIVKLTRGNCQGDVSVSSCDDGRFIDVSSFSAPFDSVVVPGDPNAFIRIPSSSNPAPDAVSLFALGIEVSTGPIVEFRVRSSAVEREDGILVVTPKHLSPAGFSHPSALAKINHLARDPSVAKHVWPAGDYVVVKRISSKESKRRLLAYHLRREDFSDGDVAFENHLNVFHSGKSGLAPAVAARLCDYLNSDIADLEFRSISGSTQVNATDLRAMSYPGSISPGCL